MSYLAGSGTVADPYLIGDAAGLRRIYNEDHATNYHWALVADVYVDSISTYQKTLNGTLDLRGYLLEIASLSSGTGLFDTISGAVVNGNVSFAGRWIAGTLNGTVSNVCFTSYELNNSLYLAQTIGATGSISNVLLVFTSIDDLYEVAPYNASAGAISGCYVLELSSGQYLRSFNDKGADIQYRLRQWASADYPSLDWAFADGVAPSVVEMPVGLDQRYSVSGTVTIGGIPAKRMVRAFDHYMRSVGLAYSDESGNYTISIRSDPAPTWVSVFAFDDPGKRAKAAASYTEGELLAPPTPNGYRYRVITSGQSPAEIPLEWPTGSYLLGTAELVAEALTEPTFGGVLVPTREPDWVGDMLNPPVSEPDQASSNQPPTVSPITIAGAEGQSIDITVEQLLVGASDPDGDALIAYDLVSSDPNVSIVKTIDGWRATPAADFYGEVPIEFMVSDMPNQVAATGKINFAFINTAPSWTTQYMVLPISTGITFTTEQLISFASDPDIDDPDQSQQLSIVSIVKSQGAVDLTDNGDGTWLVETTIQTWPEYSAISVTITDGIASKTGKIYFDNNKPPTVDGGTLVINYESDYVLTAAEINGFCTNNGSYKGRASTSDPLTIVSISIDQNATITDNGDDTWTISPTGNPNDTATISLTVSDGYDTGSGTVDLILQEVLPPTVLTAPAGQLINADNSVIEEQVTCDVNRIITSVTLSVDITHPWQGDLRVRVTHEPSGIIFNAHNYSGADADNVIGDFTTDLFNGQNAYGTWTLHVDDNYPSADDGVINAWSVSIE